MHALALTFSCITLLAISINAVPPSACFANFRWEDCGKEPEPKMYYWKPGSRCEVGIWRGCLPSVNMFKDEYECVSTCIFSVRAQPISYHNKQAQEYEDDNEIIDGETTTVNGTDTATMNDNSTTAADSTDSSISETNTGTGNTLRGDVSEGGISKMTTTETTSVSTTTTEVNSRK